MQNVQMWDSRHAYWLPDSMRTREIPFELWSTSALSGIVVPWVSGPWISKGVPAMKCHKCPQQRSSGRLSLSLSLARLFLNLCLTMQVEQPRSIFGWVNHRLWAASWCMDSYWPQLCTHKLNSLSHARGSHLPLVCQWRWISPRMTYPPDLEIKRKFMKVLFLDSKSATLGPPTNTTWKINTARFGISTCVIFVVHLRQPGYQRLAYPDRCTAIWKWPDKGARASKGQQGPARASKGQQGPARVRLQWNELSSLAGFPDLLTANELLEDRLPICHEVKDFLPRLLWWNWSIRHKLQ